MFIDRKETVNWKGVMKLAEEMRKDKDRGISFEQNCFSREVTGTLHYFQHSRGRDRLNFTSLRSVCSTERVPEQPALY